MRCWIEISAAALRHNLKIFAKEAGSAVVAPVLKSNAYGHGLDQVYEALRTEAPAWICVAYLSEAERLRQLGYNGRILQVTVVAEADLERAARANSEILLCGWDNLDAWLNLPPAKRPLAHVKVDTGLSRQGFYLADLEVLCQRLDTAREKVVGLATHFADVEDVLEHAFADQQLKTFDAASKIFSDKGFKLLRHAASSAAALVLVKSRLDMVRVGISLYGLWPSQPTRLSYLQVHGKVQDLHPALSFKTRVAIVKSVSEGSFIGYGCTFKATSDMRVAVLPLGYYEGLSRLIGDAKSYVLIGGKRCRLLGRVSMNLTIVDISHIPHVKVGDEVTLIGRDGAEAIEAHTIAAWAETIHYELLTRLHGDIPRQLVD